MYELWLKIAHTSGAKMYGLAIGVVTLIVTARWLGPDGRGVFAAITTWVALFSTVGSLSLGQVAIHRATQKRGENWLRFTLGSLIALTMIITFLGWSIALVLYWATDGIVFNHLHPGLLIIGFLMLPFMIWEQYGSSLLMAVDRLEIYNNALYIAKTISILLLLLVLVLNQDLAGVLVVTLVAQIIVSLAGLRELFRHAAGSIRPEWETVRSLLAGGLKLHLNSIGTFLIMSTNVLIINYFRGPTETGYYQFALQLTGVLFIIPTAAAMVFYSKVTQQGPNGLWVEQRRILVMLLLLMVGLAVIAAIVAPVIIPSVVGPSFSPAIVIFQLLLLTTVGVTFSSVMAAQWIGRGLFWQASTITMTVGLLNVVASLILVPQFGSLGAVWGTLATYVLWIFINGGMAVWCEINFRCITPNVDNSSSPADQNRLVGVGSVVEDIL